MLFKEITAVYTENHTKPHKYKIQRYRLLRRLGHIITTRFEGQTELPVIGHTYHFSSSFKTE
jgi:hypothetical protein